MSTFETDRAKLAGAIEQFFDKLDEITDWLHELRFLACGICDAFKSIAGVEESEDDFSWMEEFVESGDISVYKEIPHGE